MERRVLSALLHDRRAFDTLRGMLDPDDFGDKAKLLVEQITLFYDNDPKAEQIDVGVLVAFFHRNYEKHGQVFEGFIRGLEGVSSPNVTKDYIDFKKHQLSSKLGHACLSNNAGEIERLIELYQSASQIKEEQDDGVWEAPELSDILQEVSVENTVRLVPKSLNDAVGGGVPRGSHIVVFARPEVGKSMVSINLAAGFLNDSEKVLYVGNEDPAPQMLARLYARMSGMPKAEMHKDPKQATEVARSKGWSGLVFAGLAPGTIPEIEGLIKKHSPTILILDQLTNLQCKIDGQVEKYLFLAQRVRALGKKYNLVTISVCQAGDSATNKLVLEQNDVFYSNTAIPAQADIMIGVGANEAFMRAGRRMFSLPKNKVNGNHEPFQVAVDPTLSKVMSL